MRPGTLHAGFVLVALSACRADPAPSAKTEGAAVNAAEAATPPSRDATPRSMKELPTTDHAIAIGNLESQLAQAERTLAKSPRAGAPLKALVGLYTMRAQFLGRLDDYDRASDAAERLVAAAPNEGDSYAVRAGARSSMHLFKQALADLDQAERRGVRADELAGARAAIYQATGRYAEALAIRERKAREWPTIASLGALAQLRAEMGDVDAAERLFAEAQAKFGDVNPFSLAWLYLQEGLVLQKAGQLSRARELFEAARERLPEYAAATSHLASVEAVTGGRARAIALLEALARVSDDPEYQGQLAELYAESGRAEDAANCRRLGAARYRELTAAHPSAFADHAARFWLGPGGDAAQALALARVNLGARKTSEAYALVIDAALAAGQPRAACDAAASALALPHPSPLLRLAAARSQQQCGKSPQL
jgi:tetratricopeptide (TPR) repeat protein